MTGPQVAPQPPDPAKVEAERIAKRLATRVIVKTIAVATLLTAVGLAGETLVVYALANFVGGWDLALRGAFAIAVYSVLASAGLRKGIKAELSA